MDRDTVLEVHIKRNRAVLLQAYFLLQTGGSTEVGILPDGWEKKNKSQGSLKYWCVMLK